MRFSEARTGRVFVVLVELLGSVARSERDAATGFALLDP